MQGTSCSVPVGKGGLNPCSGLQGGGKPSGMRPLGVRGILWCGDEMKLVKALEDEDSQRLRYLVAQLQIGLACNKCGSLTCSTLTTLNRENVNPGPQWTLLCPVETIKPEIALVECE